MGPSRNPAPRWRTALARLPGRTAGGRVVEQVPAGILLRPARALGVTAAAELCDAVPVDRDRPAVLVAASESSDGADITADITELLAALAAVTRSAVRLAPFGPVDLLAVGQDVAESLGADVEVLTGLPLVVDTETESVVRPFMVGADAQPTWAPYVEAVVCRPYGAAGTGGTPRLVRWRSPVPGAGQIAPGVLALSDRWQVSVTRAGLVVGPRGEAPAVAGRPVSPERMTVEVDLRGVPADDALFAGLARVLSQFEIGRRDFVALRCVRPVDGSDDVGPDLRRLADEYGVSLIEARPDKEPEEGALASGVPGTDPVSGEDVPGSDGLSGVQVAVLGRMELVHVHVLAVEDAAAHALLAAAPAERISAIGGGRPVAPGGLRAHLADALLADLAHGPGQRRLWPLLDQVVVDGRGVAGGQGAPTDDQRRAFVDALTRPVGDPGADELLPAAAAVLGLRIVVLWPDGVRAEYGVSSGPRVVLVRLAASGAYTGEWAATRPLTETVASSSAPGDRGSPPESRPPVMPAPATRSSRATRAQRPIANLDPDPFAGR